MDHGGSARQHATGGSAYYCYFPRGRGQSGAFSRAWSPRHTLVHASHTNHTKPLPSHKSSVLILQSSHFSICCIPPQFSVACCFSHVLAPACEHLSTKTRPLAEAEACHCRAPPCCDRRNFCPCNLVHRDESAIAGPLNELVHAVLPGWPIYVEIASF